LTRHELKEQLQHDAFRDNVDVAVGYVATHRRQMLRWAVVALVAAIILGISYGVYRYQTAKRGQALQAALDLVDAPVMAQPDHLGISFISEQSKNTAATKALSDLASRYAGTEQGEVAQYYLAGLQAGASKFADAERNFKAVANASAPVSALARVGLAELYAGEGRMDEAKTLLQSLISKPSALVSREQATILLAGVLKSEDPKRAKQLLDSLKGPMERPAIERAASQIPQDTK
jgi:predicted negative regulator of RcsB-dependent stress response